MSRKVAMQEAFKFALSMVLMIWLALYMNWDMPTNGALAILLISLSTTGASFQKGIMRLFGTVIGLLVGLLVVGLFIQNPWLTCAFFFVYVLVVGYVMQVSRYAYAWYVSGFLPFFVWSGAYMSNDPGISGFDYATFRFLETASGVVIYTAVCALFWNRSSGAALLQNSIAYSRSHKDLLLELENELKSGTPSKETAALRTKLSGFGANMASTLDAAYADTARVIDEKPVWEDVRVQMFSVTESLELWSESIHDARSLELSTLVPGLAESLRRLSARFDAIDKLWSVRAAGAMDADLDETSSSQAIDLECDVTASKDLTQSQRAMLEVFLYHLRELDRMSAELIGSLRILCGIDSLSATAAKMLQDDPNRPVWWDAHRVIRALFPALVFLGSYLFWIFANPPGGPNIPGTAVAICLFSVLGRIPPLPLLMLLVAVWLVVIAPVYCLLMPRLSTGLELLTLVFVYMFSFAYLGSKKSVLRLIPVLLFINLTGISNQQQYSFMALVIGALVMVFPMLVMWVVDILWTPNQPERLFLNALKNFFSGCSKYTASYALETPREQASSARLRKRIFDSTIRPAPTQLQSALVHLDKNRFQDDATQSAGQLVDAVRSLAARLRSLETAHQRSLKHENRRNEMFGDLEARLLKKMQDILDLFRDRKFDVGFEQEWNDIKAISDEVQQRIDTNAESTSSPEEASDLYLLLGSLRSVLRALVDVQGVARSISWQPWLVTRF